MRSLGFEKLFGNFGDDPVALVAPRKGTSDEYTRQVIREAMAEKKISDERTSQLIREVAAEKIKTRHSHRLAMA